MASSSGTSASSSSVRAKASLGALADQLELQILDRFRARFASQPETGISKHLRYYDLRNEGRLNWAAFQRSMEQYAIGAEQAVLKEVFTRYSRDGGESVETRAFAKLFVDGSVREYWKLQQGAGGGAGGEVADGAGGASAATGGSNYAGGPPILDQLRAPTAPKTVAGFLQHFRELLYRPPGFAVKKVEILLGALKDADTHTAAPNSRFLPAEVLTDIIRQTVDGRGELECKLVLPTWCDPYDRRSICYDDLLKEVAVPFSAERRQAVRNAYRKLDPAQEGFVDLQMLEAKYNVSRHPSVVLGAATAEELYDEFRSSLSSFLEFRRGEPVESSAAGSRVPWEEFEAFYELHNGCYEDEATFNCVLTRCWDVDKPNLSADGSAVFSHSSEANLAHSQRHAATAEEDYYKRDALPAAGQSALQRVGLHHWQKNTLAESHTYRNVGEVADLKVVFAEACEYLARKGGVRLAMEVVRSYVLADDNLDDFLDRAEFRKASRECGLRFTQDEESDIFDVLGEVTAKRPARNPGIESQPERLLPVFKFLRAFFGGPLNAKRYDVVHQAWIKIAGAKAAEVPPSNLRKALDFSTHPEVLRLESHEARDKLADHYTVEFLDTFSLYVNVTGQLSKAGTLDFDAFAAYFEIYSAMVGSSDALFDVVLRRMWGVQDPIDELHPPGAAPRKDAYIMNDVHKNPKSPIYESSELRRTLFQQPVALNTVDDYVKRGLKGWVAFISGLHEKDDRGSGTIYRAQWSRLHKGLGLGLTIDESETLFKSLISEDQGLDYRALLSQIRSKHGAIAGPIFEAAHSRFTELASQGGDTDDSGQPLVEINTLMRHGFDPNCYPLTVLRKQSPQDSLHDFGSAVAFLSSYTGSAGGRGTGTGPPPSSNPVDRPEYFLSAAQWEDLVDLGLGCFETADESRLFAQSLGLDVRHAA
eukprot:g9991.t1